MSNTYNGGAAFPVAGLSGLPNDNFIHPQEGMTLRDYFAAAALQGLCASMSADESDTPIAAQSKQFARASFGYADAMLEARKEGA